MPKEADKNKKPGNKDKAELGYIKPRDIVEEMRESYIDYAMSVIVSRALPDARDGLKPVHRRILFAMQEEGLTHGAKYRKSATVVGSTLGRYHPHGDQALYDSLARMAQDFSLRYPLVEGQGNFGSIDGDPPAAMRYTECRLSRIGEEMLRDIGRDTVDFADNYDGTRKEPMVLPSPVPQLLLNGSLGIAVGMATNIPPHNLSELTDALVYFLDHPKAATEDLFQFIKGPDFPTGGTIYDRQAIIEAYSQGKGPILIRGKVEIIEGEKGARIQIVISEIPFQVLKSSLIEQFANLVQEKKIDGVKDIRDESDKEGMRIVIDLQRDAYPQKILNRLYKFSDLQKTFHLNTIALVEGIQPRLLSLPELLHYYLEHRREVTIKSSASRDDAQKNLMKRFKLTQIQANAILETKLSALAKLERQKIEQELRDTMIKIRELAAILKNTEKIKQVMKKELQEIKEKFGDERRTKVLAQKVGEIAEEDLIPQEETLITLTHGGYIKRLNPGTYKMQKRGGKGMVGMKTVGDDLIEHFLSAMTHDSLLFFTDSGKVFRCQAYEIPEGSRVAKGRGLLNFLEISPQEKVLSIMPLGKEDAASAKYILLVTKNGVIKKTELKDFDNIRKSGLIAITLKKDDLVSHVGKTTGEDEIILVTKKGQSIRFSEKQVRPMGRTAAGVTGVRLKKGDEVVGMDIITKNQKPEAKGANYLLVVTNNGYGKRTEIKEYRLQGRGGSGIKAAQVTQKTGDLVASRVLGGAEEDLIVISRKGQVIRTKIGSIAKLGRATQGVRIMRLDSDDKVASAVCI